MQKSKSANSFDINSIMCKVEKVIQSELNKLLVDYIERHELLEKTHQQLMQLPSIAQELMKHHINYDSDSDSDIDIDTDTNINTNNINLRSIEDRLDNIEKKYDTLVPVLNKLVNKLSLLNDDINLMKACKTRENNAEKSSIVKTSENENVELHIEESIEDSDEDSDEDEDEDDEDEDDVNPLMVTCSEISIKKPDIDANVDPYAGFEKACTSYGDSMELAIQSYKKEQQLIAGPCEFPPTEEDDEELSVGEELREHDEVEEEDEDEESVADEKEFGEAEAKEEEEVEEETSIETETKEEVEEEEDEELFEIEIDDKTYCTNNDENGFIWELSEEGEQGEKVGYLKDGEPFFYADE